MTYLTCDLSKVETTRILRKNLNKQVFRPTTLINTTLVIAKIKALQLLNLFDFWSFSTFLSYVQSAVALTRLTNRVQTLQHFTIQTEDFHSQHLLVQFCDELHSQKWWIRTWGSRTSLGYLNLKIRKSTYLGESHTRKKVIIRTKWI